MSLILVVEDNDANMELITALLEEEEYDFIIARDGAAGLSMAYHRLPDLVLMDVSLPLLGGLDATQRLKAEGRTRDIPVIALTAHAMTGDRKMCLDAGCDDYETKPIEAVRLLTKMRKLIAKRPKDFVTLVERTRAKFAKTETADTAALEAMKGERDAAVLKGRQLEADIRELNNTLTLVRESKAATATGGEQLDEMRAQRDEARESDARSRKTARAMMTRWKREEASLRAELEAARASSSDEEAMEEDTETMNAIGATTDPAVARAAHQAELDALQADFKDKLRRALVAERTAAESQIARLRGSLETMEKREEDLKHELAEARASAAGGDASGVVMEQLQRAQAELQASRGALGMLQRSMCEAVDRSCEEMASVLMS